MFTGQVDVISNKATWQSKAFELVDEDDGTTTDLSAYPNLEIEVLLRGATYSAVVSGTIANGKVTVPGPGFQWRFEDTDLSGLIAGTYQLSVRVTIDDFIVEVIDGTVAVIEGI